MNSSSNEFNIDEYTLLKILLVCMEKLLAIVVSLVWTPGGLVGMFVIKSHSSACSIGTGSIRKHKYGSEALSIKVIDLNIWSLMMDLPIEGCL